MGPLTILLALAAIVIFLSIVVVQQGTVAVITVFGKYNRVLRPGLNFKIPFVEVIYRRISIQNRSAELEFQAITADQANVNFKAMLVYSVLNQEDETIKNVAFKFIDERSFMQALIRTIEGSIRSFVATKRQAEILALRGEIIEHVKDQIDNLLESWPGIAHHQNQSRRSRRKCHQDIGRGRKNRFTTAGPGGGVVPRGSSQGYGRIR